MYITKVTEVTGINLKLSKIEAEILAEIMADGMRSRRSFFRNERSAEAEALYREIRSNIDNL